VGGSQDSAAESRCEGIALLSESKVGRSSRDASGSMVERGQAAWRGCPDRRGIDDVSDPAKHCQGVGDESGMREAKWLVVIAAADIIPRRRFGGKSAPMTPSQNVHLRISDIV
jgi:hypothetical protein